MAHNFAPKVRVNCIIPGLIELEETKPEALRERAEASPLKMNVAPLDLGRMVVAMSSPLYRSVGGVSLLMDGGFWLNHL